MKILAWNINQRSNNKKIPHLICKTIMDSNADIVVLTEFISVANKENIRIIQETIDVSLRDNYCIIYNIESKEGDRSNSILIATKKKLKKTSMQKK